MTKIVYFLILITFINNDQYIANQIDFFDTKSRCELAVKTRTMLLPKEKALVCIEREINVN